jgi:hypothetical protein
MGDFNVHVHVNFNMLGHVIFDHLIPELFSSISVYFILISKGFFINYLYATVLIFGAFLITLFIINLICKFYVDIDLWQFIRPFKQEILTGIRIYFVLLGIVARSNVIVAILNYFYAPKFEELDDNENDGTGIEYIQYRKGRNECYNCVMNAL